MNSFSNTTESFFPKILKIEDFDSKKVRLKRVPDVASGTC